MLVSHQERPRELKWYHAGPLLYGDWGTSRLYVLGLAFYFALYSSFWYILAVGVLVTAVGWAYTVVCRVYPDGGGVYSAARQISPLLSVVGALLLFADYAVTAAISAFAGIHYIGIENNWAVKLSAIGSVLLLGVINYIGPRRAGTFALIIACATLVVTLILVGFAIPYLPQGYSHLQPMHHAWAARWETFVAVVLALSGVEAVANMTGIMVQPISRTSKKAIWPVLVEVVLFNLVLGVAMLALPAVLQGRGLAEPTDFNRPAVQFQAADEQLANYKAGHMDWNKPAGAAAYAAEVGQVGKDLGRHSSEVEERVKNEVVRVMGEQFVSGWFGVVCGVVFGLLLISAVNTVIGGMVSVSYVMSRDRELPRFFTRLNLFGVPWVGLVPALAVPCLLLWMCNSLEMLADLYAIGVVGAIAINLSCCTVNMGLPVRMAERVVIGLIASVMIAIELTLAVEKRPALLFASSILVVGLGMRFFTKSYLPARARMKLRRMAAPAAAEKAQEKVSVGAYGTPAKELDMSRPHVMVATRGGKRLLDFAATYAKQVGGILFVLYVRQLNVQFDAGAAAPTLEEDAEARGVFELAAQACRKENVAMVPIYAVSREVSYSILDFAATYDVRALLMGVSRQGTLLRALRGDVLTSVADHLPQDIPLLIHA